MTIKHGFDKLSVNGHAFETHDDGFSATTIIGRPRAVDLRKHGGPKIGWIQNQCIQDFDLPSGEDAFHWCYYESGLSIWQSKYMFYMGKPGVKHPWDFLHTNAIDKNKHGDYIVSIRHADVLIKVAGKRNPDGAKPGTVLWRLGGKSNDFKMRKFDTHEGFTRQHDVKWISTNGTHEVLSVFNNAWDWFFGPSQKYSEGQIISLDTKRMIATREHVYPHPRKHKGRSKSLSSGRGSVQVLPNTNTMVGWGVLPEFTEFSANGTVLLHVKYKRNVPTKGREFSYRVTRSPWVGHPSWDPKLVAYSPSCGSKSPLFAYASYNGATQVRSWRFSGSETQNGTWTVLGTFQKSGFETMARLDKIWDFIPFVLAEALDVDGLVLGSIKSEVFVPAKQFRSLCHRNGCRRGFHYNRKKSDTKLCQKSQKSFSLTSSSTVQHSSDATTTHLSTPPIKSLVDSKLSTSLSNSLTSTWASMLSVSSSSLSSSSAAAAASTSATVKATSTSTSRLSSLPNHDMTTAKSTSKIHPSHTSTPTAASSQQEDTASSNIAQPTLITSFIALAALVSLNEMAIGAMHLLFFSGFEPTWNYLSLSSGSLQS